MPSEKVYNNLQNFVRNSVVKRASVRANQLRNIADGLYYKNGLLNRGGVIQNVVSPSVKNIILPLK